MSPLLRNKRRRELRHAAGAAWPASEKANAGSARPSAFPQSEALWRYKAGIGYTSAQFMKSIIYTTLFAAVALLGAYGQSPNANADQAWADLQRLATPVPLSRSINGRSKTPEERKAEIKQQAAASRQAAAAAREFYTKHPAHTKAAEARKIEAIKALRGIEAGNKAQEESAMAIAKNFRQNLAHSAPARFDVALAMDRMARAIKVKDGLARGRIEDWKNVGENLRNEFGDMPALQTYLIELAERADSVSAVKLATGVTQSAVAGPAVKARAQTILDRAALVGTSLRLNLTKVDGGELDLAQQKNKVTVVIAYSPSDLAPLAFVKRFEKAFPTDAQIVYLALNGKANEAKKHQDKMPLAGILCQAANAQASRTIRDALKIPRGPVPRVYVLNRAGAVAATGGIEELPALLVKAAG